jgi:hypothetical protein
LIKAQNLYPIEQEVQALEKLFDWDFGNWIHTLMASLTWSCSQIEHPWSNKIKPCVV